MSTRKTFGLALFITVVAACLSIFSFSAWHYVQSAKQIRTYTQMNVISQRIQSENKGAAPKTVERQLIHKTISHQNGGRDAWGSDFVYLWDEEGSFILISKGSDKSLDANYEEQHSFTFNTVRIQGQYDHDIIFKDHRPLTLAGK